MKRNIYQSSTEVSYALIRHIIKMLSNEPERVFHIAFSGGSTPIQMFDLWANDFADLTPWKQIRFWWVDERWVHSDSKENNYGQMKRYLLDVVGIPPEHIFPILTEGHPAAEAKRYSALVDKHVPKRRDIPSFDLVLLGVGSDGHTSSIFPGQEHLLSSPHTYEATENPYNKQSRIALTGVPIINARQVIFLITGDEKAKVVHQLCSSGDMFPAAYIAHRARKVELFLDSVAARGLSAAIQ